jgi:hypothetical protein
MRYERKVFTTRVRVRPNCMTKQQLRMWYLRYIGWLPSYYKRRPWFYLDEYFTRSKLQLSLYLWLNRTAEQVEITHARSVDLEFIS